jgi:hypothetical protein
MESDLWGTDGGPFVGDKMRAVPLDSLKFEEVRCSGYQFILRDAHSLFSLGLVLLV